MINMIRVCREIGKLEALINALPEEWMADMAGTAIDEILSAIQEGDNKEK